MTVILTEGFEINGGADVSPERWTSASVSAQTSPRTGARNVRSPVLIKTVDPADEHAYFCAGAGYLGGYNVQATLITLGSDNNATSHVYIRREVGGAISLVVKGIVVGTSAAGVISSSTYHYFELCALLSDTVGTADFYVDGATAPTLTFSGDTKNGGTKTVFDSFGFHGGSFQHIDDIYCANGAGSAPFNGRLYDLRCWPVPPNGNGNYSQLVGSDGNSTDNYLHVDEAGASPSSADYNGSATDGQKDTYAFPNLVPTSGVIADVRHGFWGVKSDSGPKSLRSVARVNSTDYTGADKALALSQTSYSQRYQINPDTGNPWTVAEINAAEFGVEVRP